MDKFLKTSQEDLFFEDTSVGRMKKEIWDASDSKIDEMLAEFEIPSPPELTKPGCYIQNTVRARAIEQRRKNDVVLIPVGCSENHGLHTCSAMDTFFVTSICEGVRRYTAKRGNPVNLAMPALLYGVHPHHHYGMPGTYIIREEIAIEQLIDIMLGLWNDGYRKMILVNNHGQLWMLEAVIQRFMKRYQLPGIYRVIDWHRAVREFFRTKERGGVFDTNFCHADEAETSCGLLMFPEGMIDMSLAVDTEAEQLLPIGHMDTSVDALARPSRWSECEGHISIELAATPEGVVGHAKKAEAYKAKRPVLAIMKYLVLLIDEILAAYPAGSVPPVEKITLRTAEEMTPYLKEPLSEGWKSVYQLPMIGQH